MRTSRLTRSFAAAGAAALLAASASSCGGGEDETSGGEMSSGGGTVVEAADTPQETLRRIAPLAVDENYEDACLLMSEDEKPFAVYPDLMDYCVDDLAPDELGRLTEDEWLMLVETPDERIEVGANGVGDPQLRYQDEAAEQVAYAEFYEKDGLFYFSFAEIEG